MIGLILTIIGSIAYSILAVICAYAIFKQNRNKAFLIMPILLECIVIAVIFTHNTGLFGLGGFLGLILLIINRKKIKIR